MADQAVVTVKVENLVTALTNIQTWCGVVCDALKQLDQGTVITVPQGVYDGLLKGPAQSAGGCK